MKRQHSFYENFYSYTFTFDTSTLHTFRSLTLSPRLHFSVVHFYREWKG